MVEKTEPKGDLEIAIVAAVAAVLHGKGFRVRRIAPVETGCAMNLWSHIGRLEIQASHRLFKRN